MCSKQRQKEIPINRKGTKMFMKKAIRYICAATACAFLMTTPVLAEENTKVVFGTDNEISYEGDAVNQQEGWYLGEVFNGMAPGDTRTQTIELVNENENTVSFYMAQDTLTTLEEANNASGGAYTVSLKVGSSEADAVSMLDAVAGGYKTNGDTTEASNNGLADIDELKDYTFITTLAKGEKRNMYLTISLEGEGLDSTELSDYTAAIADLGVNFQVSYDDSTPETVRNTVTRIENVVIPLANAVKTGDETQLAFYVGLLAIGVIIAIVAVIKKRGANRS